jgi:hypothetical protein
MNLGLFFAILFAVPAPFRSASARNASSSSRNRDRGRYGGFINERDLAWRPFEVEGVPPGVQVKPLSRDGESGVVSSAARLPAGRGNAAGRHASDMKMFALEGAVKIGDRRFTERRFTYIPAGVSYGPVAVEKETVAL